MSRIGTKIKDARIKMNISTKEFSKKLGVSESFITDVENGKKIINETMIKKVEKTFNINLDDSAFEEEISEPIENLKATNNQVKPVSKQWEDAFANIIKKIPVCDISFREINDYKYIPVIDKKIEGYNADKIAFISVPDDTMRGFRMQKGDIIMIYENTELSNGSVSLIELQGQRYIRQIKRLDSSKILIISNSNDIKTESVSISEIQVIGRCLRLEIQL